MAKSEGKKVKLDCIPKFGCQYIAINMKDLEIVLVYSQIWPTFIPKFFLGVSLHKATSQG
jgi:hypothetical protein